MLTGLGHVVDCAECNRLWRACATATIERFRLQAKLRLAILEQGHYKHLAAEVEAAEVAATEARQALLRHQSTHAMAAKG